MAKGGLLVAGLGFGTAIGVALGALVLAPNMSGGAAGDDPIREEHRKLLQDNQTLQAQTDSNDSIIDDLASDVVDGSLSDRPVLVIATSDARDGDVSSVKNLLDDADAIDAGQITMTNDFLAPEKADKLLSIVANTLPAGAELDEEQRDVGTHAGQALATALLLDPDTTEPLASVNDRATLLQALRQEGYIEYESGTILPAQAVVIIGGGGYRGYYADNLAHFAEQMKEAGGSTVLAARVQQAAEDRTIDQVRKDFPEVSTVDSINRSSSQLAVIMAVEEQLAGGSGAYGSAASADAAAPALED